MIIASEKLSHFIEVYAESTGRHLTDDEARAVLARLIPLYQLLIRPLPHEREARLLKDRIGRIESTVKSLDISNDSQ